MRSTGPCLKQLNTAILSRINLNAQETCNVILKIQVKILLDIFDHRLNDLAISMVPYAVININQTDKLLGAMNEHARGITTGFIDQSALNSFVEELRRNYETIETSFKLEEIFPCVFSPVSLS